MILLLPGCVNDDCGLCFPPPELFLSEIVDKTGGETLFTNGTYSSQEIKIINTIDSSLTPNKIIGQLGSKS